MPKASIVIPAYNQAQYLEYTLKSVLNQTFQDWECVIVNDGATDNTEQIAQKYVELDRRFKYVYQENKGLSGARNTGIEASQGEYVGLLDSDDLWEPQMLEKTVGYLDKNPKVDIVTGAYDMIDETGKTISTRITPRVSKNALEDLLVGGVGFPPHALLLRREVFSACGLFDTRLRALEDWDMWLRAANSGHRFGDIDCLIAHYRCHTSSMRYDIERMRSSYLNALEKFFNVQNNPYIIKLKPYAYAYQWLVLAQYCKDAGKLDELRACLRETEKTLSTVRYDRKYFKRYRSALENLPYSDSLLQKIWSSIPLCWKPESYSRNLEKKAVHSFRSKSYPSTLFNVIASILLWPPNISGYIKAGFRMFKNILITKESS